MYMMPFFFQLLYLDHISDKLEDKYYNDTQEPYVIICNTICVVIAAAFFYIEIIQIKVLGFWLYWEDARAYELYWFPVQIVYFLMKVAYPDQSFPILDYVDSAELANHPQSLTVMLIIAILNAFLIMLIGLKLFYFLTIFENFGTMIQLIYQTFN